ncbi:MAG TPA: geranylgeranylglyceryl/heptaprenylglyceryl phosphate synthase [Candidatus Altiarchaeales archaeon]|nr:geranylgeranylglyceryl/heptaprenylglyceryl phosphate synthase [Candidatus Altiarchaeales archaeon]
MNVLEKWIQQKGTLHFTLIDPDKQTPAASGELAGKAEILGSTAIMVGGSTAGAEITDECVNAIKDSCSIPVILFPNAAGGVSPAADFLFFMMLMNSKDPRFLTGEQMNAAPHLEKFGVEPIPMGYIVVSTSKEPTTVEKVGKVDRIAPDDVEKAVAYALTAKYFGMACVYLEAGSGAEKPIPVEMIKAVKEKIRIPLIVGGGIRDVESAKKVADAGADVIVTGTIAEKNPEMLAKIIKALR